MRTPAMGIEQTCQRSVESQSAYSDGVPRISMQNRQRSTMSDAYQQRTPNKNFIKVSGAQMDVESRQASVASSSQNDPGSVKDKIFQRLLLKMGKQFGDDSKTL